MSLVINGEKYDYCNGVCTYRGAMSVRNTMHKKDMKFALVVELAQLKFTYITKLGNIAQWSRYVGEVLTN